jgi:predicted 3-demethylubiquinone-9 3-methyltransferase (glyoxalase superfamily)
MKTIVFSTLVAAALLAALFVPPASGAPDTAAKGTAARAKAKFVPCLWFLDQAEAAVRHYCSIFRDARVVSETRAGPGGPLVAAKFELAGQEFLALNGNAKHAFTEAVSLLVDCADQAELDGYWEKLTADGGRPGRCGWLQDKYGVSWQIVPTVLGEMLNDKDAARAKRVADAMLQMTKIEIAGLRQAYDGR